MDAQKQVWSNFVALERACSNLPASSGDPIARMDQTPGEPMSRRTRVTEQLSTEIVRLYQAGQPSRLVAEELGISKSTVLKVLRSKAITARPTGARYSPLA